MYITIKQRIFDVIESPDGDKKKHNILNTFLILLITVNVVMVIIDTFDIPPIIQTLSKYIEGISVAIFTVEYILRVWTADLIYPNKPAMSARIKYIFSFMALIDLLAILPFYLPMLISIDLRVLRTLRIIRLFRIFKINRYVTALNTISRVFKNKASQLISSMAIVFMLMLIASVIMYNVEHEAQPEQFKNVFQSMWWAVATLTTVGYGDIYPITVVGKVLSAVIAMLGIGLVAVPTGIITSGFSEIINREKERETKEETVEKSYCPYCGHKLK